MKIAKLTPNKMFAKLEEKVQKSNPDLGGYEEATIEVLYQSKTIYFSFPGQQSLFFSSTLGGDSEEIEIAEADQSYLSVLAQLLKGKWVIYQGV